MNLFLILSLWRLTGNYKSGSLLENWLLSLNFHLEVEVHGQPLRQTQGPTLQAVSALSLFPPPPPQEATTNNIRGQLRSRDGILTDLKELRWESLSDVWNTIGPISLTRGNGNLWRANGHQGGSRKTWQPLLVKRFEIKKMNKTFAHLKRFVERFQPKTVEQSN